MMLITQPKPRRWFQVGHVTMTPAAEQALDAAHQSLTDLLIRHQTGTWGIESGRTLPRHEVESTNYGNVVSVHQLTTGAKLWIVTARDRRATQVQLLHEALDTAVA